MAPGSARKSQGDSMEPEGGHKYKVGDVVLAKIKGFPAWPGIIMDEANVPKVVLKEKPSAKNRQVFTIRFFPAADYHWAGPRDLSLLSKREIDAYLSDPHKKSGDLQKAYKIAQDPTDWNEQQNSIVRAHEAALEEAEEEEMENEDQLEEDDEEDEEAESGKKRKRAGASGKVRESAEQAKQRKKQKLEALSRAKAAPSSKKSKTSKGARASSAAQADSEEDAPAKKRLAKAPGSADKSAGRKAMQEEADEQEEVDPATKLVKSWRHQLQRAFLTRDNADLKAEDMASNDEVFQTVEGYKEMTVPQLTQSKIGKVMNRIVKLTHIPLEEQYHFKERAQALCDRWKTLSESHSKGQDAGPSQDQTEPAKAANGESHKAEDEAAAADEKQSEPTAEAEAGSEPHADAAKEEDGAQADDAKPENGETKEQKEESAPEQTKPSSDA